MTRLQSGNNSLWWPTWDIQFNLSLLGVTLHPFVVIFIHFLWLCCCFVSICRHFASHTSKNAAINSRNGKNSLQRLWWPTRDIHMTRHKTLSLWAYYWLCAVHLVVKLHCKYTLYFHWQICVLAACHRWTPEGFRWQDVYHQNRHVYPERLRMCVVRVQRTDSTFVMTLWRLQSNKIREETRIET